MTAGEIAGIVAAVSLAILVVGVLLCLGAMLRTMAELRRTVEQFRHSAVPLLGEVQTVVRQASYELGKVDSVLDRADSIAGTVDSASRLSYRAFSTPLIKVMAFATGSVRALGALRTSAADRAPRRKGG